MVVGSSSAMYSRWLEGGLRVGRALASKSVQLALGMDRTVLTVAGGAGVLRLECNSRVGQEWRPRLALELP